MRTTQSPKRKSHTTYHTTHFLKAGLTLLATVSLVADARAEEVLPTWMNWQGDEDSTNFDVPSSLVAAKSTPWEWDTYDPILKTRQADGEYELVGESAPSSQFAARRVLQNSSANITVVNSIPDQVIEATTEYHYMFDANKIFSGSVDYITFTGAEGSVLPNWLSYEFEVVGGMDTPGTARSVASKGTLALVADNSFGLQLINISMLSSPVIVGSVDTPGLAYDVSVSGMLACVADWAFGLQIIDISTPSAPVIVGNVDTLGYAQGVTIIDTLALVAAQLSGLWLINISVPSNPVIVGSVDTPGEAIDVAISDTLALVADGSSGLQIVDISVPTNPVIVGSVDTPGSAYDVSVSEVLACVADLTWGLQVIDISVPSNPMILGSVDTPSQARGVIATGKLVLVADYDSGLQVIDISTPSAPVIVGNVDTPGAALVANINGPLVLVADNDSGLQIMDFSKGCLLGVPTVALVGQRDVIELHGYLDGTLVVMDTFELTIDRFPRRVDASIVTQSQPPGTERSLILHSNVLFTNADETLLRLDLLLQIKNTISPTWLGLTIRPTLTGSVETSNEAYGVAASGMLALVAEYISGLQIIDISTPSHPVIVGSVDTPGEAMDVAISDTLALVADGSSGLQVVDISVPTNPVIVGSVDTPGYARSVTATGMLALIADGGSGLQVINISVPSNPVILGGVDTPSQAHGVTVTEMLALVTDQISGLQVIDISAPSNPLIIGSVNTPGYGRGVTVTGKLVLMADYDSGLQVIDISTPSAPVIVGNVDTPGRTYDVTLIDALVLLADDTSGLQVIDISSYANPVIVGMVDTPYSARGVTVIGRLALVADQNSGLQVVDLTQWALTGTPSSEDIGNYELVLTATNPSGDSASDTFTWRVEGPPELQSNITTQYAKVNQVLNFFVPQGLFIDPNEDVIRYSLQLTNNQGLPNWLQFNPFGAVLIGIPQANDVGNFILNLTATDDIAGSASVQFLLVVDHQPVLNRPLEQQQITAVGQAFQLTLAADTFYDADADPLTYQASLREEAALPAWLVFDANSFVFSGTPSSADLGSQVIVVVATDPNQGRAQAEFSLTVANGPIAQQMIVAPLAGVNRLYQFDIPSQTFTDIEDEALGYDAQLSNGNPLPNWLAFDVNALRFSGTPTLFDRGVITIELLAIDALGLTASQGFNLTVTSFPEVTQVVGDQVLERGTAFQLSFPNQSFIEPDNEPLQYSLHTQSGSSLPTWLKFFASNLTLSGLPTGNDLSEHAWRLVATDPYGASAEQAFTVVVQSQPRLLQTLTLPLAGVDQSISWTLPNGAFVDGDGDVLTYQLLQGNGQILPAWLGFNRNTQTLTATASANEVGEWPLQLLVSDAYTTITALINLTVAYLPQVLQTPAIPDRLRVDQNFELQLDLGDIFQHPTNQPMQFTLRQSDGQGLPTWLQFNSQSGALTGLPSATQVGEWPLTLTATDANGSPAVTTFTLRIEPNYPPEIFQAISNQLAEVGDLFQLFVPTDAFVDRNSDALTYRAYSAGKGPLPSWLSFDEQSLIFSGIPERSDTDQISDRTVGILLTAHDSRQEAVMPFQITVKGTSHTELFLRVGVPLISSFLSALAIYKQRALYFNRCQPRAYQRESQAATAGELFNYEVKTPKAQMKAWRVQIPQPVRRCHERADYYRFFGQPRSYLRLPSKTLPGGLKQPHWLHYNNDQHCISGLVPKPERFHQYVIQILGYDDIILEQFTLNVETPSAEVTTSPALPHQPGLSRTVGSPRPSPYRTGRTVTTMLQVS